MRAVIFDFDGVLVDSEPLHYRALRDALLPEGIVIDEHEYQRTYLAYDDREAVRVALEMNGQPPDRARVETIALRKAACYEEGMAEVPFFPGARDLVRALAREVPVAIASGALHREIERIVTAGGLRDLFTCIVGADDCTFTKPHPEPYLNALAGLRPTSPPTRPEDCLVFEDSSPGIASARAAGMKVVGVTHTYPAARLTGAHHVVDSLGAVSVASLRTLFAA